jgi:Tol biopolymer transport system component
VERITTSGLVRTAVISPDGRSLAYVQSRDGRATLRLRQLATGGELAVIEPTDQFIGRPAFSPDSEYLYYVTAPLLGTSRTHPGDLYRIPVVGGTPRHIAGRVEWVAAAPDGQRLATGVVDTTGTFVPVIMDLEGVVTDTIPRSGYHFSGQLAWSPDGDRLAMAVYNNDPDDQWLRIQLVDVATRQTTLVASDWGAISWLDWLPDAAGLVVSGAHERSGWFFHLWVQDPLTGETRRLTTDTSNYLDVSATTDGRQLVSIQSSWHADLWEAPAADPMQVRRITNGLVHGNFGLAALPDGRMVGARRDFRLAIIDPRDGGEVLVGDLNSCRYPDVAPDGSLIAFSSWEEDTYAVWVQRPDGSGLRRVTPLQTGVTAPRFTPDGRSIVYRYREQDVEAIHRVPVAGGESVEVVADPAGPPAVSPDGSVVAFITDWEDPNPRQLRLVSLADGSRIVDLELGPELAEAWLEEFSLRFTPDGTAITLSAQTDGVANLWRVPRDGGAPEQLTRFSEDSVIHHDWTADGRLIMSRGDPRSDAVLVRGLR